MLLISQAVTKQEFAESIEMLYNGFNYTFERFELMKKIFFSALVFIAIAVPSLFCFEVYKSELETIDNQEIQFKNYTGPVTVYNTMDQIIGIGTNLGRLVNLDGSSGSFGNPDKYYLIHAVDEETKTGLDADILVLGKNAAVDHIRNLRAIISGYLIEAYGYSKSDADTLSTFITVYNAVYRGNLSKISGRYKSVVLEQLSPAIAGLSTDYEEWAGKSQIIIPLTGRGQGSLSAVDTAVISDKNVVDSIKETDDKGIDVREDMADLKDREAEEASENAKEAARAAAEAQNEAQKVKKEVEESKKAAEEAKEEAEEAQKEADANPDDEEAQQKALDAAIEAQKRQEEAEKKEKELEEAQRRAEEEKQRASEEQVFSDKKKEEAQKDTKEIEKDKKRIETEEDRLVNVAYGLKISDKTKLLSSIVLIDSQTGEEIKVSPVNVIRGRNIFETDAGLLTIAGKSGGNASIRLVLIDEKTLEITKQSNEPVYENAVLSYWDDYYYTVIQSGKKWVIGKYSKNLELVAQSSVNVLDATPVYPSAGGICVVDENNNICLLKPDTLVQIK